MSQSSVLIVEDNADLREALSDTLKMGGYRVIEAANGGAALDVLENDDVRIVISDVQMDGMDGHTLLKRIRAQYPEIPVVLMTAYGTIQKAVEAMQDGAVDYLVKPFEAEVIVNMVARYMPLDDEVGSNLVAEDPRTQEVLALVNRVAGSDATVLISGESGTGKEVFARQIHNSSPRAKGPFVALNCAAIPENMLEAMLFGYEKGAFTGAYKSSPGKFELANGGTLLLDEISEMDMGLQAKLLRVLQEREVERLGGNKVIPLDVRVVATTNRDMKKEVAQKRFREDLYYRLNVFPVHLPSLRDRPRDIIPLMRYLLTRHFTDATRPVPTLTAAAEAKLMSHSWPGNVRELENVSQRALILQTNGVIDVDHVMFEPGKMNSSPVTMQAMDDEPMSELDDEDDVDLTQGAELGANLKNREYHLILEALKHSSGSRKSAAERLGISQRTLRYKLARMREAGLDVPGAYGDY
ncbi:MAG: sigma-54 dependent transcriptional regulator [Gammaproteobacteria bacterium]|nr:sigma-54 dependent transcriptional regulator [Gammaproteobacteria bacterium]